MPLIGTIDCYAPGHSLNQKLVREILKDKNNYKIECTEPENKNNKFFDLVKNENPSQDITNVA